MLDWRWMTLSSYIAMGGTIKPMGKCITCKKRSAVRCPCKRDECKLITYSPHCIVCEKEKFRAWKKNAEIKKCVKAIANDLRKWVNSMYPDEPPM